MTQTRPRLPNSKPTDVNGFYDQETTFRMHAGLVLNR